MKVEYQADIKLRGGQIRKTELTPIGVRRNKLLDSYVDGLKPSINAFVKDQVTQLDGTVRVRVSHRASLHKFEITFKLVDVV